MKYTVFTDGSSRGNPGPGGWAAIIISDKEVIELGGREDRTTNNRMELQAAIRALQNIPENSEVLIYTDSSYLINGITKWVKGWKKIDWMTRAKQEVLNRDLWEALDELNSKSAVTWQYVGGHAGVSGNERCDVIATSFADKVDVELYKSSSEKYFIKDILNIKSEPIKAETKSRRDSKAYSYVSLVNKKIEIHKTWPECEKRVKGAKGARYKKSLNPEDEEKIKKEFLSLVSY